MYMKIQAKVENREYVMAVSVSTARPPVAMEYTALTTEKARTTRMVEYFTIITRGSTMDFPKGNFFHSFFPMNLAVARDREESMTLMKEYSPSRRII